MKVINFILRYSRRRVLLAVGIGCIAGILNAALMALINLHLKRAGGLTPGLIWAFAGLAVAMLSATLFSRFALISLSQKMIFDLRLRLCEQALNVPLRQLEEIGAHRITATLTQDIPAIESALVAFPVFSVNAMMTLSCLAYLCWLSPGVFAVFGATMVLTVAIVMWIQGRANRSMRSAREDWDSLAGYFRALTDGSKEFKLHRRKRRAYFNEILRSGADSHRRHNTRGRQLIGATSTLAQMFYFLFTGLLLFAMPAIWSVDQATLVAYTLIVLFVRTPIVYMVDATPLFSQGNLALKKVESLGLSLALTGAADVGAKTGEDRRDWNRLEVAGITHRYGSERTEDQFVLGPLDLTFRPGELVFLVGGNGSGKTTLAKLITNLYSPETGEVRFDGRPVTDENRDEIRQLFSAVFSPPFVLDRLLGVNSPNLDRRAREYLKRLHLDQKVQIRGGKLSTTDLSQGQRKRLALLAAYLEDRPIYVFDEWAADQDPSFKEVFYLELLPELKTRGKLILVISHDDKYYHLADRVIVLEDGQIVRDGGLSYAANTHQAG